ncbi:hypothetical protein BDQ12DRAFT_668390 [Crucibulum laeve]|uniref:Uncharacterized protein n=1 Tax=Crucibulum laeve TaxID=68775 RepID=A0A5C3LT77_9AGAR|nr:hypothetical protein BDQ12DRAFT_668390 [Crucibulum laeve]
MLVLKKVEVVGAMLALKEEVEAVGAMLALNEEVKAVGATLALKEEGLEDDEVGMQAAALVLKEVGLQCAVLALMEEVGLGGSRGAMLVLKEVEVGCVMLVLKVKVEWMVVVTLEWRVAWRLFTLTATAEVEVVHRPTSLFTRRGAWCSEACKMLARGERRGVQVPETM